MLFLICELGWDQKQGGCYTCWIVFKSVAKARRRDFCGHFFANAWNKGHRCSQELDFFQSVFPRFVTYAASEETRRPISSIQRLSVPADELTTGDDQGTLCLPRSAAHWSSG
ncbi:MAG: hypothetical protein A2X46_08150 [Lentisphaerae bacterium GWF2_57_35]|nr:MAG: hypothetical protein A2X46_08150 [Lentisphaerae bacterium GWF2_57_35]